MKFFVGTFKSHLSHYLSCCSCWIFCLVYALSTPTTSYPKNFFLFTFSFFLFFLLSSSITQSISLCINLSFYRSSCQSINRYRYLSIYNYLSLNLSVISYSIYPCANLSITFSVNLSIGNLSL